MRHLTYLALLAACLLGTVPLEAWLGTRVYRQWVRLLATLLPVAVAFGGWDIAAIAAHWWHYDRRYLLDVDLPGRLPVEEALFFLVIPLCAILTLEAVRVRRPTWSIGDER